MHILPRRFFRLCLCFCTLLRSSPCLQRSAGFKLALVALTTRFLSDHVGQHSISIIAANLDMLKTQDAPNRDPTITVTISCGASADLGLFSDAVSDRRRGIRAIVSVVTGVPLGDVAFVPHTPDVNHTQFSLVLRMVRHGSPYQDQRAHRICTQVRTPSTLLRMRVDAMFQQQIRRWTDVGNATHLAVLGATIVFSHAPAPSRRLLSLSDDTTTSTQRTSNQTSSYFVRSYDTVNNADTMLESWAKPELFSRIFVVSLQYSLSDYCRGGEREIMSSIDQRFAVPILLATQGRIIRSKSLALAPRVYTACPAPLSFSRRISAPADMRLVVLQVEMIVYTVSSDIFTLEGAQGLRDIGVLAVVILPTSSKSFAVLLDRSTMLSDGTLRSTAQSSTTHAHAPTPHTLSLAVVFAIGLAVLALSLGVAGGYRWHCTQHTAPLSPVLYYAPIQCAQCNCAYAPGAHHHFHPPIF